MNVLEAGLYVAAKALRTSSVAHTPEMKAALKTIEADDAYRAQEVERVVSAIERHQLSIHGLTLLDFGCNDGSLSVGYLRHGAAQVVGVDVDASAIARARRLRRDRGLSFVQSSVTSIPLANETIDAALSYDVFEHVSDPPQMARELRRVIRPGGWVLIGTWSWRHPFAPHLWSVMPVPWAHLLVSERTLLKACRRVYHAPWYEPDRHDFDANGIRKPDKYAGAEIPRDYLNHYLITEFERAFVQAGFNCETDPQPFGSRYAAWTASLARRRWFREFLSGYVWFVLRKR